MTLAQQIIIRPQSKSCSLDEVLDQIRIIAYHGQTEVCFGGPEPTRHPYLRQMVEEAKGIGLKVVVLTQGGSRPIRYKRLAEAGVDGFHVSRKHFAEALRMAGTLLETRELQAYQAIQELGLLTLIE
mgnify:CR=1 FL=1